MFFIFTNEKGKKWYELAGQLLVESNYERVYKMAFSITRDAELSKDIAQEVFYRAFLRIDTLKDRSKFGSWILSITANVTKDMLKQKILNRNKTVPLYGGDGNMRADLLNLSDNNTPEKLYENMEEIRGVLKCIDGLDIEDRLIIYLKYFEEFSYAQIAEQMGLKENTLRTKVMRAKKKISDKIKKYTGMEGADSYGKEY